MFSSKSIIVLGCFSRYSLRRISRSMFYILPGSLCGFQCQATISSLVIHSARYTSCNPDLQVSFNVAIQVLVLCSEIYLIGSKCKVVLRVVASLCSNNMHRKALFGKRLEIKMNYALHLGKEGQKDKKRILTCAGVEPAIS